MTPDPNGDVAAGRAARRRYESAVAVGVLLLGAGVVRVNSFAGTFVYDDHCNVVEYPHRLWPGWWAVLRRPLWRTTVELNYALGGLDPRGYHAGNLTVRVLAALTLFGIARRTFRTPRLRDSLADHATPLAAGIALPWLVHPIQTESVTYIVQRRESMMGLFYLLVLYCLIRGAAARHPPGWFAAGRSAVRSG